MATDQWSSVISYLSEREPMKTLYTVILAAAFAFVLITMTGIAQQQPAPPAPPPAPMPPILQSYKPVSADRLKKPEDSDWLMIRRTYDGWGYSPLDQITPGNVNKLQPVWVFSTGMVSGHEAPPIINNGVMFAATPGNQVIAVEGKTGRILWRFRRPAPEGALLPHQTSRGVALYGDKVFFAAFDPDTGKEVWRVYTVPAPGEPGSETWPKGDQWKNGGASVWVTGNYDTETNLAFWGTGNGGPWIGDQRPGDNLYTSSTIAIDVATGTIKGHHQYEPNESWDWDEVSPPILVDYKRGGRTIKGLINVGRDGYLWFLERSSGKISYVEGKPFVRQNVFKSLDPETGRPQIDPERKPGTGKMADFCPSLWGGKNWPPIAFSPKTRLIYIPANENICGNSIGLEVQYVAVQSGWGVDANGMQGVLNRGRPGEFPEVPQGGAIWVFAVK